VRQTDLPPSPFISLIDRLRLSKRFNAFGTFWESFVKKSRESMEPEIDIDASDRRQGILSARPEDLQTDSKDMSSFHGVVVQDLCDEILKEREEVLNNLMQWCSLSPRTSSGGRCDGEGGEMRKWVD
jgi:hypothetical protein